MTEIWFQLKTRSDQQLKKNQIRLKPPNFTISSTNLANEWVLYLNKVRLNMYSSCNHQTTVYFLSYLSSA